MVWGWASAAAVNPKENIPTAKIAIKTRFFNVITLQYYYFKFFKYLDQLMGLLSKVIILGGLFVLLFGVFSIIFE